MPMGGAQHTRTLLVAAGGGGNALASLLMSRQLVPADHPLVVASYSWDRRLLDPLAGPRSATDFEEADYIAPQNVEVTANSRLRSGDLVAFGVRSCRHLVRSAQFAE